MSLPWPRARGQEQQRQSRFRLFPRSNVYVETLFDQTKQEMERETRRSIAPTVSLPWPRARGQEQQRQSRFRLFPPSNVYVETLFDQTKQEMERETRLELATSTLARW